MENQEIKVSEDGKTVSAGAFNFQAQDLLNPERRFFMSKHGREFKLRPINVMDELWLAENDLSNIIELCQDADKGSRVERINKILQLLRIAFHQLDFDDQRYFVGRSTKSFSEDGQETLRTISGPEALFEDIHQNQNEIVQLITAIIYLTKDSRPPEGPKNSAGGDAGKKPQA